MQNLASEKAGSSLAAPDASKPTSEGLVRAVGRWDVVAMTVNGVLGAGIFGLPAVAFARIGVYSLAGFFVCGALVALIALCFAEVSSRFRETGGPYLYARAAFGPAVGFQVGWTTWITRVTAFAANVNLLVAYLGFFLPSAQSGAGRALVILLIVLVLTAVNIHGVRDTTRMGNILTFIKLTPLALFLAVGAFYVQPEAFTAQAPPPSFGEFSSAILILLYTFVGFEMSAIPAGEMRDPQRDQPPGLLIGMAFLVTLYILIQIVAIGTLPGLGESERPLSDAASVFMGSFGGGLIALGAVMSILGNLTVVMLVSPRLLFAMAERRELPDFMASTHPNFHTPHFAIYVTSAVVLALSLTGTFVHAATISVLARLLGYAVTCLALPEFRRTTKAPAAKFHAPGGVAVAVLSLVLLVWLTLQTTASQAIDMGIALLIGFVIYLLARRGTPARA
ncbi:MAG: amino acid permease [Acidobacteria bacterium]|nr:amino acid permease [Acidobacteriota bacterium]